MTIPVGHHIHRERPAEFIMTVRDFLNAGEELHPGSGANGVAEAILLWTISSQKIWPDRQNAGRTPAPY